jgi:hypothetical protein
VFAFVLNIVFNRVTEPNNPEPTMNQQTSHVSEQWSKAVEDEHSMLAKKLRMAEAAPDLLAALQGVLRVADRQTIEFDAARAAIAKATGAAK